MKNTVYASTGILNTFKDACARAAMELLVQPALPAPEPPAPAVEVMAGKNDCDISDGCVMKGNYMEMLPDKSLMCINFTATGNPDGVKIIYKGEGKYSDKQGVFTMSFARTATRLADTPPPDAHSAAPSTEYTPFPFPSVPA